MTRTQAKQIWPIVRAFGDGEELQCRPDPNAEVWYQSLNPVFDSGPEFFRIKPKLREWWLCKGMIFTSKDMAAHHRANNCFSPEIIHVIEKEGE